MTTIPPEIIQFILDYLDNRDLIKVLCINWTWAQLVAPRLWQDVHFTANSNRIVFLITKSVQPPTLVKSIPMSGKLSTSGLTPLSVFPSPSLKETLNTVETRPPWSSSVALNGYGISSEPALALDQSTGSSPNPQDIDPTQSTSAEQEEICPPPLPKRRNSYPWPTLLPYHSMVHSLHVSLSSADMLQDLIDIIGCCNELRSFSILSAIPTEDLLIRGVIAAATSDYADPLNDGQPHASSPTPGTVAAAVHAPSTPAYTSTRVSQTCDSLSVMSLPLLSSSSPLVSNAHLHASRSSRRLSVSSEGTYSTFGKDDGVGWNSPIARTKPKGMLFSLLANACPKLERLWFSGFHPITILGEPTDLRPTLETRQHQVVEHLASRPRFDAPMADKNSFGQHLEPLLPALSEVTPSVLIPPVPGVNGAATPLSQTPVPPSVESTTPIQPSPSPSPLSTETLLRFNGRADSPLSSQQLQSRIHTLQFVNCTVPPRYLLTMIQHSLPELKELILTQCWPQQPVGGSFLELLAQVRPGLRRISIHGTQSHRMDVNSTHLLGFLQGLEGRHSKDEGYTSQEGKSQWRGEEGDIDTLADFPLGTFGKSLGGTRNFHSSGTNSELLGVSLQVEPSSHQYQQVTQGHQTQEDQEQTRPRGGSDLESVRVWFTHSILDEAIVKELSDRERHPRLQEVEFGSEDVFDVGEILVARLAEVRPELKFCCWVSHGDEGNERED